MLLDEYLTAAASRDPHAARRAVLQAPDPPNIGNPGALRRKWWAWHLENPHVYDRIEDAAIEMAATGRTRYGIWTILGNLRYQNDLRTTGDHFKISNNSAALYARLFMHLHPEREGFFAVKEMKR